MLSTLLLPFRLLLVLVAVLGALVVVPVVETVRGIGEEWALAFWRVHALVRSSARTRNRPSSPATAGPPRSGRA